MINELKSDSNIKAKHFTAFLLLLPVITVYASPISSVSLGEMLLSCLMLFYLPDLLVNCRLKIRPMYAYVCYALISTLVITSMLVFLHENFGMKDMIQRTVRDIMYFVTIIVYGSRYFDYRYAKVVITRISVILCVFMIIQFLTYALFKFYLPGVLPFARTTISGGVLGSELTGHFARSALYDGYARATGLFAEPAIAAQFLSVSLILVLYERKNEYDFKLAMLYTVAMILTFSVNAYVSLIFCWGIWFFFVKRKNGILFLLAPVIVIALFVIAMSNDFTRGVLDRGINLLLGRSAETSAVLRVLRGTAFYFEMPLLLKIFGSGFGNFLNIRGAFQIMTAYEEAEEYLNTNAYILISAGLIGFVLYVVGLIKEVKGKIFSAKMLVFIVLLFGVSSSIYSTAQYVIMLCFVLYSPLKQEICND